MIQAFDTGIEIAAYVLEGAGVLVIVCGFIVATVRYAQHRRRLSGHAAYIDYRHRMGRSILMGLDFLIAGDIIKTITVADTMSSVAVLGVIVLIRTFLAMTLHIEVEGCWPWDAAAKRADPNA